ncbi:MAG: hypothetical protein PF637_01970 [Spirochaetes bacterium]|jgi:uracil-DNA glycosylase family 4|nr:hypothetical protein [Spirochaetota bacterium]
MYQELAKIIRDSPESVLLHKDGEDLTFLIEWLSREIPPAEDIKHPVHEPVQVETVYNSVEACNACPDIVERKKSVGDGTSGVMIILNAPMFMSSFEKNELRKDSIDLLKKMVVSMNLELSEVYITNMIKCESSNTLLKPSTQLQSCLHFLEDEIEKMSPDIVIVFGDLTPLRRVRKKFIHSSWYEIPHPLTLIQNPPLKREAWNTMKLILATMAEIKENKL